MKAFHISASQATADDYRTRHRCWNNRRRHTNRRNSYVRNTAAWPPGRTLGRWAWLAA